MNPKQFLMIGGVILLLVGILGFVGPIGPTADDSLFGETWYFDNAENWAHTLLGVVGLIAAFAFSAKMQKPLVMLLGIFGVLVGVYSIFNQELGSAMLQNPADTILHLVVGVWALVASMGGKKGSLPMQSTPPPSMPAA